MPSRHRSRTLILCALPIVICAGYRLAGAAGVTNGPKIGRYTLYDRQFDLADTAGNPFDPQENDVEIHIVDPAGAHLTAPAFWNGDRWEWRFAPARVGRYRYSITRNGVPEPVAGDLGLECVPSRRGGYVRVDPRHRLRFMLDGGAPFYPLGCNQAWTNRGDADYPTVFGQMRDAGMNWARVWMTYWDGKNLEWSPDSAHSPPIGSYRMETARLLDQIVDAADRDGIYLQITLQHHGEYSKTVNPNWPDNPFNAARPGGFLKEPVDFFTDRRAIALTMAEYRYIVARWGYSTHIMGWELFNEVQNDSVVDSHMADVIAWHRAMADYIRSVDVARHLITTSYTDLGRPLEASAPMDYDQIHRYIPDALSLFANDDLSGYRRPVFYGEWGHSGADDDIKPQTMEWVHDGLWAGTMEAGAAGPQFWYWNQIQHENWWPMYRALTRFIAESGIGRSRTWRRRPQRRSRRRGGT